MNRRKFMAIEACDDSLPVTPRKPEKSPRSALLGRTGLRGWPRRRFLDPVYTPGTPFSGPWRYQASARACASGSGEEASLLLLVFRSLRHKHAGRDLLSPHGVDLLDRTTARLFQQSSWISITRLWVGQLACLVTRDFLVGPFSAYPEIEGGAQRRAPAAGASRSGEEASQHSLGPAPSGTRCRHESCHDASSLPPQTKVR